ncbi:chemotaxis protein CheX [Malonomonas rubra DSM 5091]|uniref:Chemotaxis protein CheX n=1 Tax=Malonomonas rubra DSM 5091 TaxID=1122189 RepID=A0A1M6FLW1_MALRU|nr:chemotaxis protein CheX [Malonomonas rubra]SHI98642.1 chemotaxis protein CheX [Malonomonas rubra DSM 5091]
MDIAKYLIESTEEVFNTMIFMEVSTEGCMSEGKESIFSHFSAMIGLSGDLMAMISIHCDAYIAMDIAGAMLCTEFDDVDDDVKDAMGEVANMLAGGMKSRLLDDNIDTTLAIPTTVMGKGYSISSPKRGNRVVVPFDLTQGRFFVDMKYSMQ